MNSPTVSVSRHNPIKSTFDDLKLYGAIGAAIVIWKPISDLVASTSSKFDGSSILFMGFLSLWAIVGIITYSSLLKQAYAWYFVHNLQAYELAIKQAIKEEDSQLFNFNLGKEDPRFITAVYKTPFKFLGIIFSCVTVFIPFVILCYSKVLYAGIYLFLSLLGSFLYYYNFKKVMKQYSDRMYL